jgi:hypothetical protein
VTQLTASGVREPAEGVRLPDGLWVPQRPSVLWVPEYASSSGPEAVELCREAGLNLDPWQEFVLLHAMGEREDGKWAAFEVGLKVPRQNGKGGVAEGRELAGLFLLPERLLIHSAHEFSTSLEAFRRLLDLIESCPELDRRVQRVSRSHGEEGIELRDGSRIIYRTRTKGGGRGLSGDFVLFDEAMNLPEAVRAALLPTLRSVPNPQLWYMGSAVDQMSMPDGLVFAGVRKRGIQGNDPSLAWFGWEAVNPATGARFEHPEDVDEGSANSVEVWASANPALGIRIDPEHMAKERRTLDLRTFAVELLCVGDWPDPDPDADRKIAADLWNACADPRGVPIIGPVCFSFDIPPGRGSAVIASAGRRADGLVQVEVVEHKAGTDWVAERMVGLVGRNATLGVMVAKASPAMSLVPAVERALESTSLAANPKTGKRVSVIEVADQAKACGLLFDTLTDRALVHLGTTELTTAVRGAMVRPLGDAWLWSRRASNVNIAPLVAVTHAVWGLATIEPTAPPVDLSRMRVRRL